MSLEYWITRLAGNDSWMALRLLLFRNSVGVCRLPGETRAKGGKAGVAEVEGELLDRNNLHRRSRSMRAAIRARWHQALELCVSEANSPTASRRGADLARQGLDLMGPVRSPKHDVGGAAAARFVRERNEGRGILAWCSSSIASLISNSVRSDRRRD